MAADPTPTPGRIPPDFGLGEDLSNIAVILLLSIIAIGCLIAVTLSRMGRHRGGGDDI